jgi:glyoxylase-like metal-dependent hydrolase (beta-lactamase superfamily II)
MGDYLHNLDRLLNRDDAIYYPTHGAPIEQPRDFVRGLISHRRRREADIFACVQEGIGSIEEIVTHLYRDVPRHLHGAAAQSVRAHLIHLTEAGQVSPDDPIRGEPRYRSTIAS